MLVLVVKLFFKTLSLLPLRVIQGIGSLLGYLLFVTKSGPRNSSRINVGLSFPHLDEQQSLELVRRSLASSSRALLEMGAFWHLSPARLKAYIVQIEGEEILHSILKEGKGLIILMPHLGLWELSAHIFPRFSPWTCLYRPLRMPGLHEYVLAGRQRSGATLVPTTANGVRAIYRALRRGESVGILPDQDPHSEARVFAPFFGTLAATMLLVPRLARNTGAGVVTAYAERLAGGRGFSIHIARVDDEIYSDDDMVAATAMNRALEACIRKVPDQYMWSYKRFKSRPEGERVDLYRRK
jgi:KDO2-lipid IV(A) lauroyltransferase